MLPSVSRGETCDPGLTNQSIRSFQSHDWLMDAHMAQEKPIRPITTTPQSQKDALPATSHGEGRIEAGCWKGHCLKIACLQVMKDRWEKES